MDEYKAIAQKQENELTEINSSVTKNNSEYIKLLIEKGQPEVLDYASEETLKGLTDNDILLAIGRGYRLNVGSPSIIKNNSKYLKQFIETGQLRALNYVTENALKGLTDNDILLAITKGYRLDVNSSSAIRNNANVIKQFIKSGQTSALNYATEEALKGLTDDDILLAIGKGYRLDVNSSPAIRNNANVIKLFIAKNQLKALEYATKQSLTEDIILFAIQKNYDLKSTSLNKLIIFLDCLSHKNINKLDQEIIEIYKNTKELLNKSGKINTLDKNPILSYDVMKYIHPNFGYDFTLNIIKYNTNAAQNIIDEIKLGNIGNLTKYLALINRYGIFPNSAEGLHYTFKDYNTISDLVKSILENEQLITISIMNNLKKVITNKNSFNITTFEELKNYNTIVKQKYEDTYNRSNIPEIKKYLSLLFGFDSFENMKQEFNSFQFDNFKNIKIVTDSILNNIEEVDKQSLKEKLTLTKEEIILILTMKKIINSLNIDEIKEIFEKYMSQEVDFVDKVSSLKRKIRLIYNYQINRQLSKIEELQKNAKTYDIDGVLIIEPSIDDKFNFLAHYLSNYDEAVDGYDKMIKKDPSLWTQLEGVSTISTSSISEKGFWVLNAYNKNGVIYLFNKTPEQFLLFMYKEDLNIQHGSHNLEPTAFCNLMSDLDSLNQKSVYHHCGYNEVAGWREGMMPCAFACTGDSPNEYTIIAAKYFGVPIIKFPIKAYDEKKQEKQKKAIENYKQTVQYQDMCNIFYDGLETPSIKEKIDLCMHVLSEKYKSKEINTKKFLEHIVELENIINRIGCGTENGKKNLRKIELYKQSLCIFLNLSEEEIITLETAEMGETGIMYKFKENEQTYLVKPAVDKQLYEKQSFRAEIQSAASKIQKKISIETAVDVQTVGNKNLKLSKQQLIEIDKLETEKLTNWANFGGNLEQKYANALLQEYVVDFLLCNFDSFSGNFIIDKNGNLRGVDKEQSFRFIDNEQSLDPSFSFVPNGMSRVPIYKTLFERYQKGKINLDLGVIDRTLEKVKSISDEEYKEIFRKYAEDLNKKEAEQILDMIVDRKNKAIGIINDYLTKLKEHRLNGEISNGKNRR